MSASIIFTPSQRASLLPALLACYIVWGSTYLAIQWALESIPPFFQMGSRFLVAGSLLALWMRRTGTPWPSRRQWFHATVVAALMLAGAMGLLAQASLQVPSGLVATMVAVMPLLMCAIGLAFGKRPRAWEIAGMLVGLSGVVLLTRAQTFMAAPMGLALLLGGCLCWAIGSTLSTTRLPLAPGAMGFASEMLCGGAILMAISLALGEQPDWPPTPRAGLSWLYLVVFGSLVAFSAYLHLLAHATPAQATSYAFVNPVIALWLGVWLGGERISAQEWMACAVTISGVVLIFIGQTRSKRATSSQ